MNYNTNGLEKPIAAEMADKLFELLSTEEKETLLLFLLDNGLSLTEEQIQYMVKAQKCVSEYEENRRRWSVSVFTVVELQERFFLINWDRGLTEYIDDEYYNQPYEVTPVERVIPEHIVIEYEPVTKS